MEDINSSIDTGNNSIRNKICHLLRNALSFKTTTPIVSLDKNIELFDPIDDKLEFFKSQFTAVGGKCVEIEVVKANMKDPEYGRNKIKEIYNYVKTEIEIGKYQKVINVSPNLSPVLKQFGIHCVDSLYSNEFADAVIVHSQYLIARSGSIAFSQSDNAMLYPSIQNLAPNIIVLATNNDIYADLKQLLQNLKKETKNERGNVDVTEMQFDMLEIVRPKKVENQEYTIKNPHYTVVMLVEK